MYFYVFLSSRPQGRRQKVSFWPQANTTMKNTSQGMRGAAMSTPAIVAIAENRCRRAAAQGFGDGACRPQ